VASHPQIKPQAVITLSPEGTRHDLLDYASMQDEIPDLSDINVRVMETLQTNTIFRNTPQATLAGRAAIEAFIRSSDKAIAEYELARIAAGELNPSGAYSSLLETMDHFDTCITSVAQGHRLLKTLKRHLNRPGLPRDTRRVIEPLREKYRDARNAIEHIEGEISALSADSDDSLMLSITDARDGLSVSKYTISFHELAALLRTQRSLSEILAEYLEQRGDQPAASGHDPEA
jgi:hypothetical protein